MSGDFTSGYLHEVTGDLDGPPCHVCGAIMVRNHKMHCSFMGNKAPCKCGYKCLSCGTEAKLMSAVDEGEK